MPDSREKIVSRTTTARSEMQIFLYNLSFYSEYNDLSPSSLARLSASRSRTLYSEPSFLYSIITMSRSVSTTYKRLDEPG